MAGDNEVPAFVPPGMRYRRWFPSAFLSDKCGWTTCL